MTAAGPARPSPWRAWSRPLTGHLVVVVVVSVLALTLDALGSPDGGWPVHAVQTALGLPWNLLVGVVSGTAFEQQPALVRTVLALVLPFLGVAVHWLLLVAVRTAAHGGARTRGRRAGRA